MSLALIAIILQSVGLICMVLWRVFGSGVKAGSVESTFETKLQHLREDDEELRESIQVNARLRENDYRELRSLYEDLLKKGQRP